MRNYSISPQILTSLFLSACFIFAPVSTYAVAASNIANKQVVLKLWDITELDSTLANIKASMYSGEQNLIDGLEDESEQKIRSIVDKDFALIKPHMQGYMIKQGSSTKLDTAYKWIVTPLGRKICKKKIIANMLFSDPEAPIPVKEAEISKDRELLKTKFKGLMFTPANGFSEHTLAHFLTLQNHTRPPNHRLTEVELKQKIKISKVKLSSITQAVIPHAFDRNFGELSLEEVTVTLNFLASDAGKAFTDLALDAYAYAITQTEPKALLELSKLFEDELSILSPYSKKKISASKARELMALLIKRHGKSTIIRAMIEARHGQMTIVKNGEEKEVYGRPNHKLVTLDTLMKDLERSGKDIREFYKIVQEKLRH
ncbi:MAG: hypothetical protein PVF28_01015 [Thioalkalispiraceae bacterium]|jgi:hypothetical protein